jgi:Ca-activated chloride channel family protein
MRRYLLALALAGLAGPTPVRADGLLVPTDRALPPLALTSERVDVEIDSQVATTAVEQTYRNNTGRDLEAEYLFPLPTVVPGPEMKARDTPVPRARPSRPTWN